jgi:hypothetical protein
MLCRDGDRVGKSVTHLAQRHQAKRRWQIEPMRKCSAQAVFGVERHATSRIHDFCLLNYSYGLKRFLASLLIDKDGCCIAVQHTCGTI